MVLQVRHVEDLPETHWLRFTSEASAGEDVPLTIKSVDVVSEELARKVEQHPVTNDLQQDVRDLRAVLLCCIVGEFARPCLSGRECSYVKDYE